MQLGSYCRCCANFQHFSLDARRIARVTLEQSVGSQQRAPELPKLPSLDGCVVGHGSPPQATAAMPDG